MSAKEAAIMDIKDELDKSGKTFIQFIEELNPIMDSLVEQYEERQKHSYTVSNSL